MKKLLIFLSLIIMCGFISGCSSYEMKKEIGELETEFYKVQKHILEMAETNDNTFKRIGGEDDEHYYYDEFSSELSLLESYIEELAQDM